VIPRRAPRAARRASGFLSPVPVSQEANQNVIERLDVPASGEESMSDRAPLGDAAAKAKERFAMPASARVAGCYEAGRGGPRLHRHLMSVGTENQVADATIKMTRRAHPAAAWAACRR